MYNGTTGRDAPGGLRTKRENTTMNTSRPKRWQAAIEAAQDGISQLIELLEEYQDWRDNIPENLEDSPIVEKLDAIIDEGQEFETMQSDLEGATMVEFPLGFGRD
jgi:hypothetical protein